MSDINLTAHNDMQIRLLTVSEVAERFGVSAKTVSRWAREGRIASVRTLGGHRRFRSNDVEDLVRSLHADEGIARA